jgi:hypothetical protein
MADPNIKILINAVDNASAKINTVNKSMGGLQGAGKKLADGFQSLTGFSMGAAGAIGIAGLAIGKVTDFTKQAISETTSYNKTVREMTQVLGLNADETSRIIQVADDWGISIEAVRTSLAFMNKTGVTPSIDNLAKLADEYVASTDKAAFAAKAVKTLGRGYQTLIPLLALGGDGFRDAAAGIDQSLIATDEGIKASREYEVVMDDLNDTVTGLKYELANGLIPTLVDLLGTVNKSTKRITDESAAWKHLKELHEAGLITQGQLTKGYLELSSGLKDAKDITVEYADATDELNGIEAYNEQITREETIARQGLNNAYDESAGFASSYHEQLHKVVEATSEARDSTDEYTAALERVAIGLDDLSNAALAKDAIAALSAAYDDGTLASDVYHNKVAQLMRDFLDMPESEVSAQLALQDLKEQLAAGTITADQYAAGIRGLIAELSSLDGTSATTTIHINTYHEDTFRQHNYSAGADFVVPPGYPNDSFRMNVESGEHVTVTPGNTTNNNNFNMNVHTNAQASSVMRDFNMMRAMAG